VAAAAAGCALPPVALVVLYLRGLSRGCGIRLILRQMVENFSMGALRWLPDDLLSQSEQVLTFHDQRGTAEQHIKEGKMALKWTRLSCRTIA
jgi:hypothetical protein